MAIIPQMSLFSWEDIEDLGDLKRLKLVLEHLPDEDLMITLEKQRKNGRNDYPIRAIWNTILAGIVFEHHTIRGLKKMKVRVGLSLVVMLTMAIGHIKENRLDKIRSFTL